MTHPSRGLHDTVHQRTRLGILTVLCEVGRTDFRYLRDTLALTDGNLSRSLTRLRDAGYLHIAKTPHPRPRSWISITPAGRAALNDEITALREIVTRVEHAGRPHREPPAQPAPSL